MDTAIFEYTDASTNTFLNSLVAISLDRHNNIILSMKIEEAIVYLLASSGHGMKIEQIAREINERGLFHRRDNAPVDGKMVYAVVMSHPEMFCKSEGRIRLMI